VEAGVFAAGERTGFENDFTVPGYARVAALAAYRWKLGGSKLTAQLNVENLLDKEYFAGFVSADSLDPSAPRTLLGSIRLEF
jgi:iron complex outermembrane receptor protein